MRLQLNELGRASRGFKVSIVEGALTVFGVALVGPMSIPLLLRMGANASVIALYTAVTQVSTPPLQLLAAALLDRYRERRLQLMVTFAGASRLLWLAVLLAVLKGGWLGAVVAALVASNALGLFAGLAWTDLIADLVEPARMGRLFALRNTILGFVNIAGLLVAKLIYDSMGYPSGYAVAIGVGTAFLLAAVPLLYMYGDPVKPKSGGAVGGLLSLLRSREALRDSAAMAAWAFSVNVAAAVWNYHLYAAFGANESWFTTLNLIGGVVGTFASPPWGSFYDRYGPRATFLLSGLGIVLVPALFPLLPSLAGQSALQVYSTFLWTGFNLAAFNYAVAYTHERRHIYIAVYNLLPALASAAGAAVGAWLYNTGGVLAFYASALGRLAALAALYRVATPRGASYEELRVASYLYPLYSAGTQALHLALLELAMVARVAYAAAVVVGLLALILTFFTVLLSVLRF